MGIETRIAPLLRGLTFNGDQGSIVIFDPNEISGSNEKGGTYQENDLITIPAGTGDHMSDTDLLKVIKTVFDEYADRNGSFAKKAVLEGTGTFYIDKYYDAASAFRNGLDNNSSVIDRLVKNESAENADTTVGTGSQDTVQNINKNTTGSSASFSVRGKISVVTGGAQGFGEGLVRYLAEAGSLVFIADRNMKGAEALAEELNKLLGSTGAIPVEVDVTSEASVKQMLDDVTRTAGGVDIFISNAGVLKAGSVKEMSLADFNFVTSVDYTGFFICTKFAAPVMALQNSVSGNYFTDIIQINSKSGLTGSNKNGAYAGAKFGGIGLTQSFALELVSDNIKVNSICPGNFLDGPLWSDPERGLFMQYLNAGKVPGAKTLEDIRKHYENMVPMKRGCTAADVIKAVYYIVDQKYETGQAVPVSGGQIMLN